MKVRRGQKSGDVTGEKQRAWAGSFGTALRRMAEEFDRAEKEHAEEHARLFAITQALRAHLDRIEERLSKLLGKRPA